MLDESVGCAILWSPTGQTGFCEEDTTYKGYTLNRARLACINRENINLAALLTSAPPVYSGKYLSRGI
jgi:hypothetical protein